MIKEECKISATPIRQVNIESDESIDGDEIDHFVDLIDDPVPEIQGNIIFFIEQFPEEYYDYILPKLDKILEILDDAKNLDVVEATLYIIGKIWNTSLDIKLSIFNKLLDKYFNTREKDKGEKILNFLKSLMGLWCFMQNVYRRPRLPTAKSQPPTANRQPPYPRPAS